MTGGTTGTCEACGRQGPVEQLETVLMPNGETVTCCPECRYHAEQLAAEATLECDGCASEVTATELERTELPDGATLDLCPECRAELEDGAEDERTPGAEPAAESPDPDGPADAAGDAHAEAAAASAAARSAQRTAEAAAEATQEATASDGGTAADNATGTAEGEPGTAPPGAPADGGAGERTESRSGTGPTPAGEPAPASADVEDSTDRPARTRTACDQCGELFTVELFQVTTVDGRTEAFCSECKDEGIDSGLVTDVDLRRAQAYEVLSIDDDAAPSEIREAYHEKVKEVHPDRSDGDRTEFMLVQEAYDRLTGG